MATGIPATKYHAVAENTVNKSINAEITTVKEAINGLIAKHANFSKDIASLTKQCTTIESKINGRKVGNLNRKLTELEKNEASLDDREKLSDEITEVEKLNAELLEVQKQLSAKYVEGRKSLKEEYLEAKKKTPLRPKKSDHPKDHDKAVSSWEKELTKFNTALSKKYPFHYKHDQLRNHKVSNPNNVGMVCKHLIEPILLRLVESASSELAKRDTKGSLRLDVEDVLNANWAELDPASFVRHLRCMNDAQTAIVQFRSRSEEVNKTNSRIKADGKTKGKTVEQTDLLEKPEFPDLGSTPEETEMANHLVSLLHTKLIKPVVAEYKKKDVNINVDSRFKHLLSVMTVQFVEHFRRVLTHSVSFVKRTTINKDSLLFAVSTHYITHGIDDETVKTEVERLSGLLTDEKK